MEHKLTQEQINDLVDSEQYVLFEGTRHTVCCLILKNGCSVVGEHVSFGEDDTLAPDTGFTSSYGREAARADALFKLWGLEHYARHNQEE